MTPRCSADRARAQRNFLATLLLSQGVPMLLHGDELGRTQQGNNNTYAQDSELSWVHWDQADQPLVEFTAACIELRRTHPTFRRRRFFTGTTVRAGEAARATGSTTSSGCTSTAGRWRTPTGTTGRAGARDVSQRPRHRGHRPARRADRRRPLPALLQRRRPGRGDPPARRVRRRVGRRDRHRRRGRRRPSRWRRPRSSPCRTGASWCCASTPRPRPSPTTRSPPRWRPRWAGPDRWRHDRLLTRPGAGQHLPVPDHRRLRPVRRRRRASSTSTTSASTGSTCRRSSPPSPAATTATTSSPTTGSTSRAVAPKGWLPLSAEARRLGLGVLVDIVPNHMGVATPERERLVVGPAAARARLRACRRLRHRLRCGWRQGPDPGAGRRRVGRRTRGSGGRGGPLPRPHVPAGARHVVAGDPALRAGALDQGRPRPQLPAVLRGQHPRRGARRGARGAGETRTSRSSGGSTKASSTGSGSTTPTACATRRRYLDDLAKITGGAYVLVEKILEPGESLPRSWATSGTTGYDALGAVDRVLTDPAGQAALDDLETKLRGAPVEWAELIHDTKRAVADGILGSEVRRIVREVSRATEARGARDDDPRDHPADRRGRRAAGLLPGLPLLPARGSRAPRPRVRRRPRPAARPGPDAGHPRAGAGRPGRRSGQALPADQRHGDGQGRRGLRVLPLVSAHLAQRGRRRPQRVRADGRRVPRGDGRPAGRLAARDDHPLHPRHQARRGRPRPDHRARRDPARLGRPISTCCSPARRCPTPASDPCCGRRSSAPGRPLANGCTRTPRRRCARPATTPPGPSRTRPTRRPCTPPSTRPSTTSRTPGARRAARPRGGSRLEQLPRGEAGRR